MVLLPYRTSACWSTHTHQRSSKPHLSDLDKVTRRAYLQYLYRNVDSFVFTLPYFTKPAPVPWSFRLIAAERHLYRLRDQSVVAAYLAQCGQTLLPEPQHHTIQRLLNVTGRFGFKSATRHSDVTVKRYLVYRIDN